METQGQTPLKEPNSPGMGKRLSCSRGWNRLHRNLTADPAHDPPRSRFSLGEVEASMNIRYIMRTWRVLLRWLPARGFGAAESQAD